MATVAARAPKRELAPDWRDALREAVRRYAGELDAQAGRDRSHRSSM